MDILNRLKRVLHKFSRTTPLAFEKSICPGYFCLSRAIVLPMSFIVFASTSNIASCIAAWNDSYID